jgi:hypothetical protein
VLFGQLNGVIDLLDDNSYKTPLKVLNDASIGQHYRHLLEIFICLEGGYKHGIVNYDNRKRDRGIEEKREVAKNCIESLSDKIIKPQKPITLTTAYNTDSIVTEEFASSYHRELAYALEHAVHHMAIIRIGLNVVAPGLYLPANFGVAASTVKYIKTCAP